MGKHDWEAVRTALEDWLDHLQREEAFATNTIAALEATIAALPDGE